MDVQIGKWPDFIMTRGKELVSYSCIVSVAKTGPNSVVRRVTHRSLKMLADEVLSVLRGAGVGMSNDNFDTEFKITERKYEVVFTQGSPMMCISLQLERGIRENNIARITNAFDEFLQTP